MTSYELNSIQILNLNKLCLFIDRKDIFIEWEWTKICILQENYPME